MPYVQRDTATGKVSGLYANPQPDYAEEWLADDHADVAAFETRAAAPPSFLARDLFAKMTPADRGRVALALDAEKTAAFAAAQSGQEPAMPLHLLWDALGAQGEAPIVASGARFAQGWAGLSAALGATRAAELATALWFGD
jgi:hypothetical protein